MHDKDAKELAEAKRADAIVKAYQGVQSSGARLERTMFKQNDAVLKRPKGSNADEWAMFLEEHKDATPFLAVQIAEALDAQDAEIAALKAEVGYWKSKSADFGRSIDDLSDAHDAIVIERDRLREALTKAHDDLYLNEQDTMASYERINAIKAGMFAALSPEQES